MLHMLRSIVQQVNSAPDLEVALETIVQGVYSAINIDAGSVYLVDPVSEKLVLLATKGMNEAAVGLVRLSFEEGLVGLVAQRSEPVNVKNALDHTRYKFVPEVDEEDMQAFLGVPIINYGKVLGVVVVQRKEAHRFADDHVSFLITLAAQLAGAIAQAGLSGDLAKLQRGEILNKSYQGLPGSPGLVCGTAVVVYQHADLDAVPDRVADNIELELEAFHTAVATVRQEMEELSNQMQEILPSEEHALFDAFALMLSSGSLIDDTVERIKTGNWASGSLRETIHEHTRLFREMSDPYLRERADDIRDLGRRVIMKLQSRTNSQKEWSFPQNGILIGEEITATQFGEVPIERLRGIVSIRGSSSSHVAILARAMEIPCAMGVSDLPVARIDGKEIIVDGYDGQIYIEPDKEVREHIESLILEEQQLAEELKKISHLPAETTDKHRLTLFANTGLLSDVNPLIISGAEGIGLYRTEIMFQMSQRFPSESEQYDVYRKMLESMHPRPVVLRTLDVGGDKALEYFPVEEDNPFLGWRGIRITLDHPEIFMAQIRAMLRANIGFDNLQILLPMISHVQELKCSARLIQQAYDELFEEGYAVTRPKLGVMIEVPSSALLLGKFAPYIDFVSIGSNDLTQYMLAVDRNNERVSRIYDPFNPAVLEVMQRVVDDSRKHHLQVGICGEMAGDPMGALLLLGMGLDSLSMSVGGLGRVKRVIRNFSKQDAENILRQVLDMSDGAEIRQKLHYELGKRGLAGLLRAGY